MINSKVKITGHVTAKCYDQSCLSAEDLAYNKKLVASGGDRSTMKLGKLSWKDEKTNLISNEGFEVIGQLLTGLYGSTGEITHCALGTGTTAPTTSDTQLTTEVYRNNVASSAVVSNITDLTAYYSETEVTGTFEEFGTFIDGTAAVNSGKLWTHVLTGGWTKSSSEALVISITYTMTSS